MILKYVFNFRGEFLSMNEEDRINVCRFSQDLQKMKIGTQHRNRLWRSVVEKRSRDLSGVGSQDDLQRSGSTASSTSVTTAQNTGFCPGFYEVTRYTFKHTISSVKPADHDYC